MLVGGSCVESDTSTCFMNGKFLDFFCYYFWNLCAHNNKGETKNNNHIEQKCLGSLKAIVRSRGCKNKISFRTENQVS